MRMHLGTVEYHVTVALNLTSDLVFRIKSGAYLILFEVGIPNLAVRVFTGSDLITGSDRIGPDRARN